MRFFDILDTYISKKFQNGKWITRKINLLKNAEHRPINILSVNVYQLVNKSILNVTKCFNEKLNMLKRFKLIFRHL